MYNCHTNAYELCAPKGIDEAESTAHLPSPRMAPAVVALLSSANSSSSSSSSASGNSSSDVALMFGGQLVPLDAKETDQKDRPLAPDSTIHRFDLKALKWLPPISMLRACFCMLCSIPLLIISHTLIW